ncbi:MAG: hypothetical protein K2M43_00335, partial [Mycoplasmoidaceae bacterium]|nr:hypothetical protein [Mycoplasmoidaceae bacterium]
SYSYYNAIYINLTTHKIEDFNGAKEIKENFKDSVPKDDNNKTITQEQPYMYIVNDQEGFINRLNYLLSVYRAGAGAIDTRFGTIQPYLDICNKFLSESELTFCKDYYDFYGFSPLSEALQLNNADIVYSGAGAYSNKKTGGTILDSGSIFTDINKQGTNEYVNFIEDITTEKTSDNQTYVVHKGTLKYSFMSK